MKKTVFYSWQSDRPNATNRSFIENALKEAARQIAQDESVNIDPVIDRDTQGMAGAPDIGVAILSKISAADLFVADITFVAKNKKHWLPNANVMVELGYALKEKGHEGLILVFNTAFGKVEKLPFDLKMKRTITYSASEGEEDRSAAKAMLIADLKAAMLAGFETVSKKASTPSTSITDAIEQNPPNKIALLRRHLEGVMAQLEAVEPKMHRDGGTTDEIVNAISKTKGIASDFARLTDGVALMGDLNAATEIFRWFSVLLRKYYPSANEFGRTSKADGDFYKFLGHEFFTMLVASLLREKRLDIAGAILKENLRIEPKEDWEEVKMQSWTDLSDYLRLVEAESQSRGRKSLCADMLRTRHTEGDLGKISPFREFSEVDYLLFLYSPSKSGTDFFGAWYPRSVLYLDHVPFFLREARDYPYAIRLAHVLGARDVEDLKRRVKGSEKLGYDRHSPFSQQDIESIGSTGHVQIVG